MARKLTNFYIDPELTAGLEAVRERDGITVAEQIRRAIRAWLKTKRIRVATPPAQPRGGKKR